MYFTQKRCCKSSFSLVLNFSSRRFLSSWSPVRCMVIEHICDQRCYSLIILWLFLNNHAVNIVDFNHFCNLVLIVLTDLLSDVCHSSPQWRIHATKTYFWYKSWRNFENNVTPSWVKLDSDCCYTFCTSVMDSIHSMYNTQYSLCISQWYKT